MGQLVNGVIVVLTAIIGVAILSVLVSRNAQTAQVIQAGSQGFSSMLGTAISPVSGQAVSSFAGGIGSYPQYMG